MFILRLIRVYVYVFHLNTFTCFDVRKAYSCSYCVNIPVFTLCLKCSVYAPLHFPYQYFARVQCNTGPGCICANQKLFPNSCRVLVPSKPGTQCRQLYLTAEPTTTFFAVGGRQTAKHSNELYLCSMECS